MGVHYGKVIKWTHVTKSSGSMEKFMGSEVYDCRRDIHNILVRPRIRARFCRLEPPQNSF